MAIPRSYNIDTKKVKKKKGKKIFTCFFLLAFLIPLLAILAIGYYNSAVSAKNSDDGTVIAIEIESGMTNDEIADLLISKELINNRFIWTTYVRINNFYPKFKAEKYKLPKNLSIQQMAETLTKPPEKKSIWITFREGLTMQQTIALIKTRAEEFNKDTFDINKLEDIIKNPDKYQFSNQIQTFIQKYKPEGSTLEGFLFPETYSFEEYMSAQEVVEVFLNQFIKKTSTLNLDSSKMKFYEALVLASIVERESNDHDDRGLIAGVFYNRLQINMLLQSDATVNYVTGKSDPRAQADDLKIDSKYNTYKYPGLPPGPIANPRFESIRESLNPTSTKYYYFIHDENGKAYFAETDTQHYDNVRKYLDN